MYNKKENAFPRSPKTSNKTQSPIHSVTVVLSID